MIGPAAKLLAADRLTDPYTRSHPTMNTQTPTRPGTANGSDEASIIAAFNKTYYKPGTVYKLIFGGANAGTVTVKSSDAKAECSKNIATATTRRIRA